MNHPVFTSALVIERQRDLLADAQAARSRRPDRAARSLMDHFVSILAARGTASQKGDEGWPSSTCCA
jgi:hypothetical protein